MATRSSPHPPTHRPATYSNVALGRWGEAKVAAHYLDLGYELLASNWQIRGGELDLVLRNDKALVFCEVKTRSSTRYGSGLEAINPTKQAVLRRTAMAWVDAHRELRRSKLRFDVAVVLRGKIRIIEAAF